MSHFKPTLYYIHDPMCSWCWGFRPVWMQIQKQLNNQVEIYLVLGGLAADNNQVMPESMQHNIRNTWLRIQQTIPGTKFNYDFWDVCTPRRSTYPACRAVVAAGMQSDSYKKAMVFAIQQAYYINAKNPSDDSVLIQLAIDIGLDRKRFEIDLASDECKTLFQNERQLTAQLNVSSFPALVLKHNGANTDIQIDYNNSDVIVADILALI